MTFELPTGWCEVRLGDICVPVAQRGPDSSKESFRYIDLGSLDNKQKQVTEAKSVLVKDAPSRAKQNVKAGDVVFSTVRVYLENIASVSEDLDGAIASTAFCVLRPAAGVDPRFLYHFVTSRRFILAVNKLQRGNSPPSVQDGDIRSQPFPLVPSTEQERIAYKIEELFSRIDEGERALERVQKLIERYRQSVLKAAVTGELTRAWREQHKGKLESGEALLQRILAARRAAWEKAELDRMKAKGQKPANDHWRQKYQEPLPARTTELPKLPEGWVWASGAQLFEWSSGDFLPAKMMSAGKIPVYGGNGINGSHSRWNVDFRTIVVGRVGVHCGNVHLTAGKSWITDNAIFATFTPRVVELEFFSLGLRAASLGQHSQGGAQPFVNQKTLNEVAIPVPPADEQLKIVDSIAVEIARLQAASLAIATESIRSHALRQSVLRDAFSGLLITQDAADEPASVLLERIAAERNASNTTQKRCRSPAKRT